MERRNGEKKTPFTSTVWKMPALRKTSLVAGKERGPHRWDAEAPPKGGVHREKTQRQSYGSYLTGESGRHRLRGQYSIEEKGRLQEGKHR